MTVRARLAVLLAAAVTASTLVLAAPAQAAVTPDGSSPSRAAASCWEIKQNTPNAGNGLYWLVTPRLQVPTRFYCDQTTDGGGWVLIGRGRHQWVEGGDGWGTTAEVGETVTGQAALRAKQLSNRVIDGLLDGGRVDELAEGIRLKRATNRTGTAWQEVRFTLKNRDRWTWALSAGLPVSSYTVGSTTTPKAQTSRSMTIDNDTQRTWTGLSPANGYASGWSYGKSGPAGDDDPSTYLYSAVAGGAYASPFTQMYLRPKLTTASRSYSAISDTGTPAQAAPAVPESGALPSPWGVAGLGKGGTLDYATEVSAFAQIGNVVYVGGNFTTVRNSAGTKSYKQPYLAAFDATTGAWMPGFRPKIDNQVKALAALPNGRLAVGGQFTKVNGRTATSLVVVNRNTGATWTTFKAKFTQKTKGAKRWVRALDVSGQYLYVGGGFTHYTGGTAKKTYGFRNIVRVKASDGTPNASWAPNLGTGLVEKNGKRGIRSSVLALDVSDNGSRVYAAGQFQQAYVGDDGKTAITKQGLAAITTGTKATFQGWPVTWSSSPTRSRYQQAVKQVGTRVWTGGSQHNLFSYLTSTLKRSTANMTLGGGDIQSIATGGGFVYASCHCYEWNYSGMLKYDGRNPTAHTQVDRIGSVGAWDATTGAYVPEFAPTVGTRKGEGPWAVMAATDGTLWSGGDYTSVVGRDGKNQWTGGFARFAMRPHTPPAGPSGLKATLTGGTAKLTWNASSTSGVSYEILRNDRVVALTDPGDRSVTVPDSTSSDRWFVRATDGRGNRSASTSVATAQSGTTPTTPTTLVDSGEYWAYWFDKDVPVDDRWKSPAWEPGDTWPYGPSTLGWGPNAARSIDTPTTDQRALSTYFRRRFTADPTDFRTVTITTRADDGAVVYLNGTEVGRRNMPSGPITPTTYATNEPAVRDWTITVPASMLRAGNKANTIAVEVHLSHRAAPGMSHDAVVTAR